MRIHQFLFRSDSVQQHTHSHTHTSRLSAEGSIPKSQAGKAASHPLHGLTPCGRTPPEPSPHPTPTSDGGREGGGALWERWAGANICHVLIPTTCQPVASDLSLGRVGCLMEQCTGGVGLLFSPSHFSLSACVLFENTLYA